MGNTFFRIKAFPGICLLCLFLSAGCGDSAETRADTETEGENVKLVKVSPVRSTAPEGSIEYVGVLTAHRKVMVASEAGGTIEKLYFEKGDRVKKGQLLAEINTSTFRLQVRKAKAAVEAAKSHFENG